MQEHIDALLAAGAQNVWPKFTFYIQRTEDKPAQHQVVAEVMDGVLVLTDAGHALLKSAKKEGNIVDVEVVSEKRKTRAPTKEKVVEDSNEILDDLDLIE